MLFFEDFNKKINDIFDKGYAFKVPLTLNVNVRDKFFMNYFHKSEFPVKLTGPALENECKVGYARDNKSGTILLGPNKLEAELEYVPAGFSAPGRFLGFKTKKTLLPRVVVPTVPEQKNMSWGFDGSLDTRFSFAPDMGHNLKLICDELHWIPKVGFSTLYNRKPLLFGINYVFDKDAVNMTGPFEILLGVTPVDGVTAYLRHVVNHMVYPGTIGLGVYSRAVFETLCDKYTKDGVKSRVIAWPTEFVAEGSVDLNKLTQYSARTGVKVISGKHYTIQAKFDSDFKFATAFGYVPKKWVKFIWSMQFNTKKLVTAPTLGVDYVGGFAIDFNFSKI